MLDEAGLDARTIRAVLAGEVSLAGDHATAHFQMLAKIRCPGVHLAAAGTDVKTRPDDREERRLWKTRKAQAWLDELFGDFWFCGNSHV